MFTFNLIRKFLFISKNDLVGNLFAFLLWLVLIAVVGQTIWMFAF